MSRQALVALALLGSVIALSIAGEGRAIELREPAWVAAGSPVLENATGTLRLEDGRLGPPDVPVFVPEPATVVQLGVGSGLLALLVRRRRRSGVLPLEAPARESLRSRKER